MTYEQKYFLQLLEDYVHRRPSVMPFEKVDWLKIAEYAREQSLEGIVYVQCRDLLDENSQARKELHKGFYSAAYVYANGKAVLEQMEAEFQKSKISFLPFKGAVLRRYYPNPELRIMGDIDVLIHSRDKEAADRAMKGLGYDKFVDNHAVWTYLKPNVMIEIHNAMFYEYLSNSIDYRGYFDHIWETAFLVNDKGRYEPEPNRHFLYLICHTAKHVINHGIGFRAFLDMVFMAQNEKKLDWDWIKEELNRLQLLGFTETCFALCQQWFHVSMPLPSGKLDQAFFEEVTAKTFCDGTFGLQNEQNEGAHAAKEIQRAGRAYWRTALILTWKKIFPPYEDMQLIPWYSFVDGRPWLMPVAWIYRWLYTVTHKFKHTKNLLVEPFVKRDRIKKREDFINSWKL